MTAIYKLDEAKFFLDKMSSINIGNHQFKYYASACNSALYSSLQHLLYEYAKKYWPTIDPEEYLDNRHFKLLAKATDQKEALRFINWYEKLRERIKSNEDANQVMRIRHMDVHRTTPPLDYQVMLIEPLDISDRFEYGVMRPSGTFEPTGSRPPTEKEINAVENSSSAVFISGYRKKQLPEVLSGTWIFFKSLIDEAKKNFGSP